MLNHPLRCACGMLLVLLIGASSADADTLYMSQTGSSPSSLHRLDSESPGSIYPALFTNTVPGNLRDIHLDPANNTMYWAVDHPSSFTGSGVIRYSDLDGNGTVAVPITTTLGQIYGLTVDPAAGLIFFSTTPDLHAGAPTGIMSVPITGGAVTPLLTHGSGKVAGVVVDPVTQKLYASLDIYDASSNPDRRIIRMDYNGNNIQVIYDLAGTDRPGELEIDFARNRLAFMLNDTIAVGSPDGIAPLQAIPTGYTSAFALGSDGQQVFYSKASNDSINVINMNGTGNAYLSTVFNAYALEALVPEPAGVVLLSVMGVGLLGRRAR